MKGIRVLTLDPCDAIEPTILSSCESYFHFRGLIIGIFKICIGVVKMRFPVFEWSMWVSTLIFQNVYLLLCDVIRRSIFTPSLSIFHFWRVMNAAYFLCAGCQTNYQRMKFNLGIEPLQGPRHSAQKWHILQVLTKLAHTLAFEKCRMYSNFWQKWHLDFTVLYRSSISFVLE